MALLEKLLTKDMWKHVVVVFTKCNPVLERANICVTNDAAKGFVKVIKTKMGFEVDLPFVRVDSGSRAECMRSACVCRVALVHL